MPTALGNVGASTDNAVRQSLARAASVDALPTERGLVKGTSIDSDAAQQALTVDGEFEQLMARMHHESNADHLSSEITRAYSEAIQRQIDDTGSRIRVSDLVCGLKVCVAEFGAGAAESDWEAWRAAFEQDERAPHTVFMGVQTSPIEGQVGYRVLFSTDAEMTGVTASAQPR